MNKSELIGYKYLIHHFINVGYTDLNGYIIIDELVLNDLLFLPCMYSNREIVQALKDINVLKKNFSHFYLNINDFSYLIEVNDKQNKPICKLKLIKEVYQYDKDV